MNPCVKLHCRSADVRRVTHRTAAALSFTKNESIAVLNESRPEEGVRQQKLLLQQNL